MHIKGDNLTPESPFGQFSPDGPRPLMAMIEVTNRCNMSCPICYSGADYAADDVPLGGIKRSMERLLEVTGSPVPLQISGGEPTVRKDLPEIISLAKTMGFRHIELITNGIRISEDPSLLQNLRERGLSAVYLQFDGLKKETYLKIRGQDLPHVRRGAVEAVRNAGLCCTLAVTVVRGVNHHEIGDIVRFAIEHIDTVRAVNFQSATRFKGRFSLDKRYGGYGLPDLIDLIASQSGMPADTFISDHLGHPSCNALSYLFLVRGKQMPLFKYIERKDIKNFLGDNGRDKIQDLFSGKKTFLLKHFSKPESWGFIRKAAPIFGTNPINLISADHLLIFAKSFMEKSELDPDRIKQCCYGISTPEGVFSFCAYNNLYRFSKGN